MHVDQQKFVIIQLGFVGKLSDHEQGCVLFCHYAIVLFYAHVSISIIVNHNIGNEQLGYSAVQHVPLLLCNLLARRTAE